MSAKTVGTPAVKFVETLQGAITVRADQDTILMVTYGHVKGTRAYRYPSQPKAT